MIAVGHLKQRANLYLVGFVFACILVTTGLLWIMQSVSATGDSLANKGGKEELIKSLLNN